MPASNAQVQAYVDQRVRPRSEQIRALFLAVSDDKAAIDDVYANLTSSPTWTDGRTDNPPHLLTPNDVLAWNAFISGFLTYVQGSAEYAKVLQACTRGVG